METWNNTEYEMCFPDNVTTSLLQKKNVIVSYSLLRYGKTMKGTSFL